MRFGLNDETISQMQGVFAKHPEVEQVVLYGSRAKGNYRPSSDIDLTMKGSQLTLTIQHRIAWELDDLLLPYTIDLSIHHQISNPELLSHIERVGVVFYSK